MKVLVAGATGYLGRFVVQELKKQGFWVRALARKPHKLSGRGPFLEPAVKDHIDEVFIGEVTKPETLEGLCDEVDVVFSSIGITRQKDKVGFMGVDYQGNKNLLNLALDAGVKKFVFVSVFQADVIPTLAPAREMFVRDLEESGLDHVVVRPTGYFSDMSENLKMARSGRVFLIGDGQCAINPIHGADLAKICVDAMDNGKKYLPVGGPKTYSHEEIARLAFAAMGKPEKINKIPAWLSRAAVGMLRPFSERYFTLGSFFNTVMTNDFEAPKAGKHTLEEYFQELVSMDPEPAQGGVK